MAAGAHRGGPGGAGPSHDHAPRLTRALDVSGARHHHSGGRRGGLPGERIGGRRGRGESPAGADLGRGGGPAALARLVDLPAPAGDALAQLGEITSFPFTDAGAVDDPVAAHLGAVRGEEEDGDSLAASEGLESKPLARRAGDARPFEFEEKERVPDFRVVEPIGISERGPARQATVKQRRVKPDFGVVVTRPSPVSRPSVPATVSWASSSAMSSQVSASSSPFRSPVQSAVSISGPYASPPRLARSSRAWSSVRPWRRVRLRAGAVERVTGLRPIRPSSAAAFMAWRSRARASRIVLEL